MPRGDGTGPMGTGSMTGRAVGYCAGSDIPGFAHPGPGRMVGAGFGRGRGGRRSGFDVGRGWRNRFRATDRPDWARFGGYGAPDGNAVYDPKQDLELEQQKLNRRAKALQSELDSVRHRLSEIEAESRGTQTP
jgi:hypothetical protein